MPVEALSGLLTTAAVRRAEKLTRVATGATVAGPAGVVGAISFSFAHMSKLALEHGQLGWKSTVSRSAILPRGRHDGVKTGQIGA
jgi:hypothetical protein